MRFRQAPPEICPECGAERSYLPQYTTGGGWRIARYRCEECGRVFHPYLD